MAFRPLNCWALWVSFLPGDVLNGHIGSPAIGNPSTHVPFGVERWETSWLRARRSGITRFVLSWFAFLGLLRRESNGNKKQTMKRLAQHKGIGHVVFAFWDPHLETCVSQ